MDAAKTVERILSVFPLSEQHAVRNRLGKTFRYIISQRLLPKADGKGRVGLIEILKSTLRTREYVERGEGEGKTLLDAMRDGTTEGMQYFDGEIERLIREGGITIEAGLTYATNAGNLRLQISDLVEAQEKAQEQQAAAGAAKDGEFEIER
jgi:twitching motility protein PilT